MAQPRATTARPAQAIRTHLGGRRLIHMIADRVARLCQRLPFFVRKFPQVADHCDAAARLFPAWCDAERLCRPPQAPGRDGAIASPEGPP